MDNQTRPSIDTLFPWLGKKALKAEKIPSMLRFILHGKNKDKHDLNQFYKKLGHFILVGNRQDWAFYHSYLSHIPPSEQELLFKEWTAEEDPSDWKKGVMIAQQLQQFKANPKIMVGLAWDCLKAFELIWKNVKDKLISKDEASSWVMLLTAMMMKAVPSRQDFIDALVRDLHWAYHQEGIDTSLLKKKLHHFIQHKLKDYIQEPWDFRLYTKIELDGRIRSVLQSYARHDENIPPQKAVPPFTLNENLFDFLYKADLFSVSLNLTSLIDEPPYMEQKPDTLTTHHVWHTYDKAPSSLFFTGWLKDVANVDNEEEIHNLHQSIIVQGHNKKMGAWLYWLYTSSDEDKKKLLADSQEALKNATSESVSQLKKDIKRLEYTMDPKYNHRIPKTDFSLYDKLNSILLWRNSWFAQLTDFETAKMQIQDIGQLILNDFSNWESLTKQFELIHLFKAAGDMGAYADSMALQDVLIMQPAGPIQNIKLSDIPTKDIDITNHHLIQRSLILSNDERLFQPSPKTWALNIAAPLLAPRQQLLTHDIASSYYRSENALFLRYNLGIHNIDELKEHLNWLQLQGRRGILKNLIDEYSHYDQNEIDEEIQDLVKMSGEPVGDLKYRIRQLEMIRDNTEAIVQCRFWALDIIRYSALIQRAVVANLMTEEEAWPHLIAAASALQHRYNDWEDALWDFFRGWIFDASLPLEANDEFNRRKQAISSLLSSLSPVSFIYKNLPWDMPLGSSKIHLFNEDDYKDSDLEYYIQSAPTLH